MRVNTIELYVEDLGNKDGDAVFFLNGVMASTNSWYVIMKPFIDHGYRVILHDFKGQLKSDKPEGPYTFDEHAKDTLEIMKNLGIKKAHFVGTSYGGEVALNIGFRYPEVVKSLVIIDSTSQIDGTMKHEIMKWIELCRLGDGYQFFNGILHSIYSKKFREENKDFLEARAKATASVHPSYFKGQIILYQTFLDDVYMSDRLEEITAPTLVICGDDDQLKPLTFSRLIHEKIKGSKLIILKDCGHVAIFEKAKEVENLVFNFIKKTS
jgi:3-oxoadipate enol-lactonase